MRLLAGLESPDGGTVRRAPGVHIGYLPQAPNLPREERTVLQVYREGLAGLESTFIAGLIGHGFFRLEDVHKSITHLSAGQRRKLELARIIVARPTVLLLDEPINYVSLAVARNRSIPGIGTDHARADFGSQRIVSQEDRRTWRSI